MTPLSKKLLTKCIYCTNAPEAQEHWLNRSLGTFAGNTLLTGRLCTPCNERFGRTIDQELVRSSHIGVTRQLLGIEGRSQHERKNVFEYKASQTEPPVQLFRVDDGHLRPVFEDAVARLPDGNLVAIHGRALVIATPKGEQHLRFPKGWNEHQLRSTAERRGLLGGRPLAAHVPPPETVDEFVAASRDIIRAVFGPFEIDVYYSRVDGPVGAVEPTVLRFNLNVEFFRGVAKIAFHYFLWACPHVGGDEPQFSAVRAFIRDGVGEPATFLNLAECLVDRIDAADGAGRDCHVFSSAALADDLLVQVHFFSQPVGPSFPTFVVRLGSPPTSLAPNWRSAHVAAYVSDVEGHDGTLKALSFDT